MKYTLIMLVALGALLSGCQPENSSSNDDNSTYLDCPLSPRDNPGTVEVLHWWVSDLNTTAMNTLQGCVETAGHTWLNFTGDGSGDPIMSQLQTRVENGDAASAAQIKGTLLQKWAANGWAVDISMVTSELDISDKLPGNVEAHYQYNGSYIAAPVNVHRTNWLWINKASLDAVGMQAPQTLSELWSLAAALEAASIEPLAHGNQDWQNTAVFETLALSIGGTQFYQDVFVNLEDKALNSETLVNVFTELRTFQTYFTPGTDPWKDATAKVIAGNAAMQAMGDWVTPEFIQANKEPNADYLCIPFPGTGNSFLYNMDSLLMMPQTELADIEAQADLARAVLSPQFQLEFSKGKGSIPSYALQDEVMKEHFDTCAQASWQARVSSDVVKLPSMAHGMSVDLEVREVFYSAVQTFWDTPSQTATEARDALVSSLNTP